MAYNDSDRLRFYPVAIGQDLVRQNMFEFIFTDSSTMISGSSDILRIMCKSFTVQLPNTHSVEVQWVNGVGQYAGRQQTPYQLATAFYVGNEEARDAMSGLYKWRNLVMDHKSGKVYAAGNYKRSCYVNIYDVTGDNLKYQIIAEGLWPTNISDIQLAVENDGPIELTCTFAADRMDVNNLTA